MVLPQETPMVCGRGLMAADGLAMLVHQGARAFTLFTGEPAPVEVMLEAARAAFHPEREAAH